MAVEFIEVSHDYGAKRALDTVSLSMPTGAIVGLVGPNGSGKSTTLNIITSLLPHSAGEVRVQGLDPRKDAFAVKKLIGYAPEEVALYNGLSAREFVELSAALHHMAPDRIADASAEILRVFGLEGRMDDLLGSFSKGMRRKALLASALVHEPELLILDEPLEGLDVVAQRLLRDLIRQHVAKGKTVIYSTHLLEVLEGFCTYLVLLKHGTLLGQGSLEEVRAQIGHQDIGHVFTS